MQKIVVILVVIIVLLGLTGGLYVAFFMEEDEDEPTPDEGPFVFDQEIPQTTFYHFDGGIDAATAVANGSAFLNGSNVPYWGQGTYYSIGVDTFEPTIGVTSTGALFMTSHNGLGVGTHIIRSQDQGQTWEDVTDPNSPVLNSNDPYLYVDPWTDRLIKFDMHALLGMTMEYSDDEGDSWATLFTKPVTGYTPQDHQTIASMPPPSGHPGAFYETIYVYSINTGLQGGGVGGSYGSFSLDGGQTWSPEEPHYEIGVSPAAGLSGHLVGSEDGAIYRGQPAQGGPAAYRSTDGGIIWTEHVIANMGTQSHEVTIGTDEGSNVHAIWIGDDDLPYYSNSQDQGDTWRPAMMVAPPGVIGSGFPTCAGGADGKVAFSYIGTNDHETWNGYVGILTDAFAENPLITTVAVNAPDDPLDETPDCGYRRCGGFGDFIDICIDPDGRPWAALSHNPSNNMGIVGTFMEGPALRGNFEELPPLPEGGPSTL